MKFALVFLALVGYSAAHDMTVCADTSNIQLMGTTSFNVGAQFLQTTVKYLQLPESGFYPSDIACIVVKDQTDSGTSGEVQIVNGGLSSNFVNFKFTSNWSQGMKYKIDIYQLGSNNMTEIFDESN